MPSEDLTTLKNQRGGHVSALTKVYNECDAVINSRGNIVSVSRLLEKASKQFELFKSSNADVIEASEDRSAEENYFQEKLADFLAFEEKTKEYIKNCEYEQSRSNMQINAELDRQKAFLELERERLYTEYRLEEDRRKRMNQRQEEDLRAAFEMDQERHKYYMNSVKLGVPIDMDKLRQSKFEEERLAQMSSRQNNRDKTASTAGADRRDFPKPQLLTFSGEPLEYIKFIANFEANFDRAVMSNEKRLDYLISHCKGKPKLLIGECVLLGDEGYQFARKLLHDMYGQPHTISQAYITQLTNGPAIKANDTEGLEVLSSDMIRTKIALSKIGFGSDIENTGNLRRIVNRLPFHCKSKWLERADSIDQEGRMATFADLTEFVGQRARVARSLFAQDLASADSSSNKPKPKYKDTERAKASTFAVTAESSEEKPVGSVSTTNQGDSKKCWCCDNLCRHLSDCKKFVGFSMKEKKAFVWKKQLCYNCFGYKHTTKTCQKDSKCTVPDCTSKHHTLMHEWWKQSKNDATDSAHVSMLSGDCMATVGTSEKTCLRILPVEIVSGNNRVKTYAMLDDGATQTLCTEQLAKLLGVRSIKKNYTLNSLGGPERVKGNQVSLSVRSVTDSTEVEIDSVWTVKELPISLKCMPTNEDVSRWPHLAGMHLPDIEATDVTLLIGGNAPYAFWNLEERRGKKNDPYARRTPLGWTILGPVGTDHTQLEEGHVNFMQASSDDLLRQDFEKMWTTDFPEIDKTKQSWNDRNQKTMSQNDRRAMKIIEDTTVLKNGHYTTSLPWKDDSVSLPNNRKLAEVRLSHLKKKLKSNHDHKEMYCKQMTDYLQKGYAVPCDDVGSTEESKKTYYLPHHGVVNVNKPGKVRVVFDCAAKYQGMSLNDNLLQGPDLVNSLVGVLIRFRQEHTAFMADVEGMFNQVKVSDEDSQALRFLWWPDNDLDADAKDYRMLVQIFGAASSPCIATHALKRTVIDNKTEFSEEASQTVDRNFYVDDLLKSVQTPEQAISLVEELTCLLRKGGFRLTKWISNDKSVLATIPDTEKAPSVVNLALDDELPVDRALGVRWNVEEDVFMFVITNKSKPYTRRGILSVVASLYDPLGFVAPVTLFAKLLLQKLCRDDKGWDDVISDEDVKTWCTWLEDLHHLAVLKIPRCYRPKLEGVEIKLHVFSDASERGYGACGYLRIVDTTGQVHVSFVLGRSRLAPIKTVTLPRLELSAAVVGVRIKETIRCELEIEVSDTVFWSDSMIVIAYIRNTKSRFKTFVANRLTEIHESTNPNQWRHVPSEQNPADIASRCITASDEERLAFWLEGPAFLKEGPDMWPSADSKKTEEEELEVKHEISVNVIQATETPTPGALDELINRYSSIQTLQRVWAWLMRFKTRFIRKHSNRPNRDDSELTTGVITADEVKSATVDMIKYIQSGHFTNELTRLKKNNCVLGCSKLASLNPMLLDGVLVVGGRIRRAKVCVDSKHQIILPRKHHFTTMMMRHLHEQDAHIGPTQLLSNIRGSYWIPHGLQECKSLVRSCVDCKKRRQRPGRQMMADLPEERLMPDNPPFHSVGIDYFGPLTVKLNRSHLKRYGVIFTCLATRAVHFEIAHSLNTDSFLAAFTRFCARRGRPDKVFSDNGTNLVSGDKELREMLNSWNQLQINDAMVQKQITWRFNPPHASHMGGVWERLIRSAREILKALAKEQILQDESLLTVIAEAERILNDRPITALSDDVDDPLPLTPAMLLLLKQNKCLPAGTFCKSDCYPRRWFKQAGFLSDQFWKRWTREYLPALQTRQIWQKPIRNVAVNDLVLMVEDNVPRGRWPLAIVTEVKTSDDGHVRSCSVRAGNSSYDRPIHKLCLLEQSA